MNSVRKLFITLSLLLCIVPIHTQSANSISTNLSWHGISFNNETITKVGLNWIYGSSESIEGAQLNFLFGNVNTYTTGWQSSLLFNLTSDSVTGFQSSFFLNRSTNTTGLSFALLGINIANENILGTQIGAVSLNKTFTGVQFNAFSSISFEQGKGLQIGASNIASDIKGVQIGGINYSDTITGVQIGLINKSKITNGVQIGLINICDSMNGIPIGIIDIQRNGENHVYYFIETPFNHAFNQQYHTIGYRFGSKYLYKSIDIGFKTGAKNNQLPLYSTGFHCGIRVPLINNSMAIMSDLGINIANWQQRIEINNSERIRYYLIPESKEIFEWKCYKKIGVLFGFKQRYYSDVWNNKFMPENMVEIVRTPDGSLFIQNSVVFGIEY